MPTQLQTETSSDSFNWNKLLNGKPWEFAPGEFETPLSLRVSAYRAAARRTLRGRRVKAKVTQSKKTPGAYVVQFFYRDNGARIGSKKRK